MRLLSFVFSFWILGVVLAVSVWPQPQTLRISGDEPLFVENYKFKITTNSSSYILTEAIIRYSYIIFPLGFGNSYTEDGLNELSVVTLSEDETLDWNTDVSYKLIITSSPLQATIFAPTVFGAMYGLESFSQIVEFDLIAEKYFISNSSVSIMDIPRFNWRGLLVDTSRHYIPVGELERMIDSLSFAKMNVLHWHVTDSQSFPLEVTSYPLLCNEGAYFRDATYSRNTIHNLVDYAKGRGVRLVPEIDMPGHSYSWGFGYPNLTVDCSSYSSNIANVPLDPSQEFTYEVISGILTQLNQELPDAYLHIGGDEVVFDCWLDDPRIKVWMEQEGLITGADVEQYFYDRVLSIVLGLPNARNIVLWEDMFNNGLNLSPEYCIIQAWKDTSELATIVKQGFRGLLSGGWYLDKQVPDLPEYYAWQDTWKDFYAVEPSDNIPPDDMPRVLGGEACMWGEKADAMNIESFVWPRTAAVAERLWSPMDVNDVDTATPRLVNFRCRLAQRGIRSGPANPDYCPLP